jgi:hypothetical protein
MLRPLLGALAAPLLALTLTGCSGGKDSPADVKADVAAQMVERGFNDQQADCFANIVVDQLGAENVKDLDFSKDDPPAGQEEEYAAAAIKALTDCDVDLSSLDG